MKKGFRHPRRKVSIIRRYLKDKNLEKGLGIGI